MRVKIMVCMVSTIVVEMLQTGKEASQIYHTVKNSTMISKNESAISSVGAATYAERTR